MTAEPHLQGPHRDLGREPPNALQLLPRRSVAGQRVLSLPVTQLSRSSLQELCFPLRPLGSAPARLCGLECPGGLWDRRSDQP